MSQLFTREDADALRDAADVLRRRSKDPRRIPPTMTHLAVTAADLEREAGRIEDEISATLRETGEHVPAASQEASS